MRGIKDSPPLHLYTWRRGEGGVLTAVCMYVCMYAYQFEDVSHGGFLLLLLPQLPQLSQLPQVPQLPQLPQLPQPHPATLTVAM